MKHMTDRTLTVFHFEMLGKNCNFVERYKYLYNY